MNYEIENMSNIHIGKVKMPLNLMLNCSTPSKLVRSLRRRLHTQNLIIKTIIAKVVPMPLAKSSPTPITERSCHEN